MTTANTNARAIDALREEIDTLDQELLALMEKRLDLAAAIAAAERVGDTRRITSACGCGDGRV